MIMATDFICNRKSLLALEMIASDIADLTSDDKYVLSSDGIAILLNDFLHH